MSSRAAVVTGQAGNAGNADSAGNAGNAGNAGSAGSASNQPTTIGGTRRSRGLKDAGTGGLKPSASTHSSTVPDIMAQVEDVLARAGSLGKPVKVASTTWRIEVTRNGKYWQWRSGAGKARRSRYGGRFATLTAERQAQYWQNRRTYARTGKGNTTASTAGVPEGGREVGDMVCASTQDDADCTGRVPVLPALR